MTCKDEFTFPTELLDQIAAQGLDFLLELIRFVINTTMQVEHQQHLRVDSYESSTDRRGYANGFKPETVITRITSITL